MKSFFEGIASLFVEFLFVPMDLLAKLEFTNWWAANILIWIFIIMNLETLVKGVIYWYFYRKKGWLFTKI